MPHTARPERERCQLLKLWLQRDADGIWPHDRIFTDVSSQDVCDKVSSSDTGAQQAVQAMIRRLAHRNANVQLYTLELANALSQNCGIKMHKELASRSFTEALLRLANDRNTHQQVKAKILERMSEWSDMFSRDPDLGIMQGAYNKLKSQSTFLGHEV